MLLCVLVLAAAAAAPQAPADSGPPDDYRRPPDNYRRPPDHYRRPPENFRRTPEDYRRPADSYQRPPRRRPTRPDAEGNYHLDMTDSLEPYGGVKLSRLRAPAPCVSAPVPQEPDSEAEIWSTPRTNKLRSDNEVVSEPAVRSRLRVSTTPAPQRSTIADVQLNAPKTNVNSTRWGNVTAVNRAQPTLPSKPNDTQEGNLRLSKLDESSDSPLDAVIRTDSKPRPARPVNGTDDKWIWGVMDAETTTLPPDLDDRSAFEVSACPEGKARVRNMCVEVD